MALVSILLPAFFFEDTFEIDKQICNQLGMRNDQFQLFPFDQSMQSPQPFSNIKEYAIQMTNSDLSLQRIEWILEEQNITQKKVEKCKEALTTLSQEFNKLVQNPSVLENLDNTKLAQRTKKLKQVKEDNKKLRQLLKAQLENSEKMRVDTQTTVETLREEFDLLVNELSNLQRKEQEAYQQQQQQQNQIEVNSKHQFQVPFQKPQQIQQQQQQQQKQINPSLYKIQLPSTLGMNSSNINSNNYSNELQANVKQNNYFPQQQQLNGQLIQQGTSYQAFNPNAHHFGIPPFQENKNFK